MPIASPKYRFDKTTINGAPSDAGVYALYVEQELIYIGRAGLAGGIQSGLLEHYFGLREPRDATHYAWEICRDPQQRQLQLLREFESGFLALPRYNRGSGGRTGMAS